MDGIAVADGVVGLRLLADVDVWDVGLFPRTRTEVQEYVGFGRDVTAELDGELRADVGTSTYTWDVWYVESPRTRTLVREYAGCCRDVTVAGGGVRLSLDDGKSTFTPDVDVT